MKRWLMIICLSSVVLFMNIGKALAQKPGSLTGGFETQMSMIVDNGFKTMGFASDFGVYATKWMSVAFKADVLVGMFDRDDAKTYRLTEAIGGQLMFTVLRTNVGTLSINTAGGATVGPNDWKYAYYSGGVYFNVGKWDCKPFMGMGVRYFDTYKRSDFDDYLRFYFSFGVRLF